MSSLSTAASSPYLCTGVPEKEVNSVFENLVRAVEGEKGELAHGRVRRLLDGIEGMVTKRREGRLHVVMYGM